MAAFLAEFSLCGLVPGAGGAPAGVLGVEPGGEETDRLLVTDRGRAVTLYKVSDQKPLGSWTVKQGQTITCPAVCNFATGEYVAVHDDKVLRIWKDDDVNLDKVFKATLSADVHRLHSLPNAEPLVVFKGGATRFLDALLAAPQQEIEDIIPEGQLLRWSELFLEGEQTVLLFITEGHGDCFVYVQNLKLNSLLKYKLQPEKDASLPLSFTASLKKRSVTLLTLYSRGLIYETDVPLQQPEPLEQQLLPKSLLLKLPAPINTAVVVLDTTHVAVLGALPNKQEVNLCIWNIKFQTLQTFKELPQGTSGQLWCYGGKLYVTHGKMLTVIPYQCGTSSLVAALGKQQDSQASGIKTVTSVVNWNVFLQDGAEQSSQDSSVKGNPKRSLRQRKDSVPKAEPETSAAERLLCNIKNCSPRSLEDELKQFLSNAQMPDYHITIGKMASAIVRRCKTEPNFYPRNVIIELMQTSGLSHSSCPDLIQLVIEKDDMHLLQICLQQFRDVPEAVTCACLKAILNIGDATLEKVPVDLDSVICYIDVTSDEKVDQPKEIVQNGFNAALLEEDSCDVQLAEKTEPIDAILLSPVSMKKAALLNAVLLTAYSETFLLPHLKDLSAQQVVLFLQYLQYLYVKCSEKTSANLPGANVPNINQIMDWMSLLLDAHFTVVVMLPEAKGLLANLHKFVRSQVKLYSELNKIEGSLLELQRIKRQKKDNGLYSIEILELV